MTYITRARLLILFATALLLCTAYRSEATAQKAIPQGTIELEQTSFAAKSWKSDGSHLTAVKGRLTLGERPVAHALLQVQPQGRTIVTEEDGSFKLLVDRSLVASRPLTVLSVHDAKIAGKPVEKEEADSIRSATSRINVYYPIEVIQVSPSDTDKSKVKVHARLNVENDDKISFFKIDKYRIAGKVTDADGNPVKGAVVWIDRDSGEGFAKSTPTDRNGNYEMYYWPEEEETNLTVIVGTRRYELPKGKVIHLPHHTSVDIRIRLPREGLVLDDRPPNLVCTTSKGVTYTGLLAGLDVPTGTSYSVTIPDRQGRFVVTVSKDVWETRPLFYETVLTRFIAQDKIFEAGDELPDGLLEPGNQDPRVSARLPR
ncbi:carboxypeptidase-like regulatory domain-containing protein [Paenibacillus xylaniclasticus]|uniref:carboxypeptidase-like regulatory domain-containing protein n=1 Tax=Paenibacillus xylaniclasticus TaxID=588083 RepID=UPI0013E05DF4|nr:MULTISPECIES: carboxypeptidase-like regulatory domain-containing protein [Paenibacillus]GFN32257.1 hypothetical protein PCURB6_25170 [Paenibacillus curdlanolyticus]